MPPKKNGSRRRPAFMYTLMRFTIIHVASGVRLPFYLFILLLIRESLVLIRESLPNEDQKKKNRLHESQYVATI